MLIHCTTKFYSCSVRLCSLPIAEAECQKRWKSIRDHYRRQKKEGAGTGSAAKKKRATYWDRLNFLGSVEDERDSFSNVSSEDVEFATEGTSNETECEMNNDCISEVEPSDPDTSSHHQEPVQSSATPQPRPNPQSSKSASMQPPPSKKRKENSAFLKYLADKKEDRAHLKTCMEELVKQTPPEDEVDMFFKTMAMTVKKFPPNLLTEAKVKIFQTVTDIEMKVQQQSTYGSTFSTFSYDDTQSLMYSSSSSPSNTSQIVQCEFPGSNDVINEALCRTFPD